MKFPDRSEDRDRRHEGRRPLGAALAAVGRVALWAVVALLLVRGAAAVLAPPAPVGPGSEASAGVDPATGAFAVRFARLYLEGAPASELSPLLAPGAPLPGYVPASPGVGVEQAEVAGLRDLDGGRAIVTVACELTGGRTVFLAVPTARASAGGVAALGEPAVVAGPPGVGGPPERPRPLAGPGAAAISALVRRFLPAYLAAESPSDLSYLVAPGTSVVPPGGGLRALAVGGVSQEGGGEGGRRTVIAATRVRDRSSGATLALAYRLQVVWREGRWYVAAVMGALS